jgi:hypothetical protein
VVVGPLAGTRPAEAERIVVANEDASTVQFFDLKAGNVLKISPHSSGLTRRPGSEIHLRANRVELCVELGVPHRHSVTVVPSLNKAYTANKDAGTSQSWT